MDIKFISYDGSWPNLCSGTLELLIDGTKWVFDRYYKAPWTDEDGNIHSSKFWISGGCAGVDSDCREYCESGPWELDESEIPEQLADCSDELIEVFNDNVPWGCCGGCI